MTRKRLSFLRSARPSTTQILFVLLGIGLGIVFLAAVSGARLARWPAEMLIHSDPLVPADVIVAETWAAPNMRVIKAAGRLYRQGYGRQVIIPYQIQGREAARTPEHMHRLLGVYCAAAGLDPDQVEMIQMEQAELNTLADARKMSRVLKRRGAKSVILVTTLMHSRKSSMSYRKFLGPDIRLICYPVKGNLTVDNWWHTSAGRYEVLFRFLKLQYYRLVAF